MNRDEVHIRDRLLLLAECSNPHKPFNVKRKTTLTKQGSKTGPKLSVQDFVRMDPGYTPDIEHLVFPARKRNPQQVAPISTTGKTRSRLAEMFALSRHLQQRSTDRDTKTRNPTVNRSVDSASAPPPRRWVSGSEEPVRGNSNTRISPAAESDMAAASGQFPWRRRGTESLGSSPGLPRKLVTQSSETSHTAPVTPLHEGSRRRSPLGVVGRRAKASSTPQLLEAATPASENRKWSENTEQTNETRVNTQTKEPTTRRNLPATTSTESVLQKFRKTFSLRFHPKKQSSSNRDSCDLGEALSEMLGEPSEDEPSEPKSRFGPLIWRSSKERKKLNKAARNAKCNSGDSGIQIEMMPGCGGADSSESHDTDPPGDDLDSPPSVRRRTVAKTASRPHSDLLNQILIDKFKSDLKQRPHRHNQVRRTRSDLGGQRLLQWDSRSSYKRLMSNPSPLRGRPQSPRKKPPDAPGGVQLRLNHRRGQLRRSLSQPLDIDKLSPLMRTKTAGLKTTGSATTSDDEAMSDSESSIASLTDRKKSLEMVILAEAVFDHVAFEAEELAFRAGDLIEVLETANREWWWGTCSGKSGWFPSQFVRLRVSQEDTVEDCLAAMASGHGIATQLRRRTSISLLSNDQVRTSVVKELLRTERDFVKVLEDVAEGYIAECRKRTDMFTEEQIKTIFINLEDILHFQANFVKDLEAQIDFEAPYKSCVGGCFLKHRAGFKMYSEYCNSHPTATAALQELYQYNHYSKFFEACRLMRGLIEIPLDGYLLTPVQRICKYPLQLAELLKYTRPDHKDYDEIKEALDAMRGVAVLINERKRRMESLEKLAAWQQRVEGWEGEDLIDSSTQLIHQGDVVKVTTGMWTNNITLFLFDHQVVYCKKDILKRNTYVYKGRICTETSEIIDVTDGKDNHLGVSVRHAIKIHSCIRDKWLLFCCRSSSDKQRWLQAFAEERKLVAQDKDDGLEFPSSAKQLAKVAARCQRRPPRKPRAGKSYKHPPTYMGSTLQLNSNSLGRKVGTWFTFGGHKKSRHRDVS
nr:PREDICTED: spermatogenesis-associated protein 13 isoform X1 [Tribolium castaneum]|eukprot:XP_008197973.1 PREDICTED: spermatogenesis-associated protein 13 isoform X1 [Tribolium castaneum]